MSTPPGRDAFTPRRPGLLCNPGSGRFARDPERLLRAAQAFPGGLCREGRDPVGIHAAVREVLVQGADIIIVLGGDGTLQAVLDSLAQAGGTPPHLAIVPCGTTNMTALDLGCGDSPTRMLARLRRRIEGHEPVPVIRRSVLRVSRHSLPALHGMFFGMGIITAGVRYFREHVRGTRLSGEKAAGYAALRTLLGLMSGAGAGSISARISGDDGAAEEGSFLFLMASTLHRLLLGARPYWGNEAAPMHVTSIRSQPRALWRSLPRVLSGNGRGLEQRDYRSRNLRALTLECEGDFVLDGEIHPTGPEGGTVCIDADDSIRFAVP
jgi:diacylglycerol kinase family enzyme